MPISLRPHEAPHIEPARCTPHAKPIMHQQLDACGTRVGEQVTVVGLCPGLSHLNFADTVVPYVPHKNLSEPT